MRLDQENGKLVPSNIELKSKGFWAGGCPGAHGIQK